MIKVLQIIDTLHAGGAERLAVNYANGLLNFNIESHICVTRAEGPLLKSLDKNVNYTFLKRKSTFDVRAILRLKAYVLKNKIDIIHAHSSSFFIATLVKLLQPKLKIIWHDHYGNSEFLDQRPKLMLRWCSKYFSQIFSVNNVLSDWAKQTLNCKQVRYIKNFPVLDASFSDTQLQGNGGKRILCLANLREQKNHIGLLKAFRLVKEKYSDWSLHCVGKDFKDDYSASFFSEIKKSDLQRQVFFYDSKSDILNILHQSTIGILVSKSEGLPLALLEYGLAKLPVICTNVGNCSQLISDNSYGILLENDKAISIANAIVSFIEDSQYRKSCALNFNSKVSEEYAMEKILGDVARTYNKII